MRRLHEPLRETRARAAEGAFVVEGPRTIAGALDRGAPLERVFFGPGASTAFGALAARIAAAGIATTVLKEGVLERVGSTVTPQPVLAIAPLPRPPADALSRPGLVVLGIELSDPGNLGVILRSAEASGAAAIVLSAGSVDAYNPKVVRASAGAIFGIPVLDGSNTKRWSAVEALDALGEVGRQRLGADAVSGTRYDAVDFCRPTAIVLGNEARGLGHELDGLLDGRVSIPMTGAVESLNVGAAATVLCFESARQRSGMVS
ncbi:MAG TPA: RNA methyltransferase [Acidimicrobiia bacterium]